MDIGRPGRGIRTPSGKAAVQWSRSAGYAATNSIVPGLEMENSGSDAFYYGSNANASAAAQRL